MNLRSVATHLDAINWIVFFSDCQGVNAMYAKFVECCQYLINMFTPTHDREQCSSNILGYIARLKKIMAEDPSRSTDLSRKLLRATNRYRVMLESKLDYKDSRAFFQYANSRLKGSVSTPILKSGSTTAFENCDKAELLAEHFSTLYRQSSSLQSSSNDTSSSVGPFRPTYSLRDTRIDITEHAIFSLLSRLKSKCSYTPDGIPPIFYKVFAPFLAEPLKLIFERSYNDGVVPDLFRQSIVTPLHKKGPKTNVGNYRPVSQCSIACGIFEKLIVAHMSKYLRNNNLLDPAQHGFVAHRSTCTQLLEMTQDWAMFLNSQAAFHCVYFDQKSAFDRVDHKLLLKK